MNTIAIAVFSEPKNCAECPLCYGVDVGYSLHCSFLKRKVGYIGDGATRNERCPLIIQQVSNMERRDKNNDNTF